ncbi:kinesin family member 6/9 [Paragonimus westermani]|uniref:Kinesin family member 6/9 n=1 Tax=Paragonimus westermani TaxID=34504 RepID=A0A5J4P2L9_9TREM|nr:kinesin family member 6/9 [Paragonimus westermani]
MVKQTIQIVLRLRPPRRKHVVAKYDLDESSSDKPKINLDVGKASRDNVVCNRRETYRFQFDAIFDTISGQDQIFDTVSKPVVDKVLEGYNGTVFSYGQTGSGKTFTITGGAEKYSDRGIIPRAIAYIFKHFEMVIIALSEKQRTHVPYRNSMMTMVLRDSLGGNCMTSMIANCSIEQDNLLETISTCRFAQRVALIKNDVVLNEEQDPRLIICRLRQEVDRLKAELVLATGREYDEELSEEEKERLSSLLFNSKGTIKHFRVC